MILTDTNVLLRYVKTNDKMHLVVVGAVSHLQMIGEDVVLVPQNLYEFWVVATRPTNVNGFGWMVPECRLRMGRLKRVFRFLPDRPDLFDAWEQIVFQNACHGKVAHDARLVAAMQLHRVGSILTFNVTDFTRFPGITVIDPATVAP